MHIIQLAQNSYNVMPEVSYGMELCLSYRAHEPYTQQKSLTYVIRYWIDFRVGGRGTVCLSHVVLGDYIIHIFNNEIHMGRYVYVAIYHY